MFRKLLNDSGPAEFQAGDETKYAIAFNTAIESDCFVIWVRVSTEMQRRRQAHRGQVKALRRAVRRLGATVLQLIIYYGPGYDRPYHSDPAEHQRWSNSLTRAAEVAQDFGGKILAVSFDRFVRNPKVALGAEHWDCMPRVTDLTCLKEIVGDVPLVTLVPPGTSAAQVRRFQSEFGQVARGGNVGGRPRKQKSNRPNRYKARLSNAMIAKAMRMQRHGFSLSEIGLKLDRSRHTIASCLRKAQSRETRGV